MLNDLRQWGRGIWTPKSEEVVAKILRQRNHLNIGIFDVANALQKVAKQPNGYAPEQKFEVFEFCQGVGHLYAERIPPGNDVVTYTFASPMHRRYV